MPRRGENIYKRKDGRWEGRILRQDGKYQSIYAKSYKEVKEKRNNMKEISRTQDEIQPNQNACATQLLTDWLNHYAAQRVKPSTFESYYCCTRKYFVPFFESSGENKITNNQVDLFIRSIISNPELTAAYKKKVIQVFKTAIREICKGPYLYPLVIEKYNYLIVDESTVEVFSVKEQRLIEVELMQWNDKKALGILLCFYTGIRLGELCALKWENIDFDAGTLSVVRTVSRTKNFAAHGSKTYLLAGTPKSRKSMRKIPIPDFMLKIIKTQGIAPTSASHYIFTGSDTPIDPRTLQKLFKKLLIKAGVKDRKFHAIRHTFATRALELGVDIKTVSEILGHSSVTITLNIYAHSMMEQKIIAIEKLNEMHKASMKFSSFAV